MTNAPPVYPKEEILREIAAELADMQERHTREIEAMRRKLKIAMGDIRPRKTVVRFELPNGKFFEA